jgi:hypothetical protein
MEVNAKKESGFVTHVTFFGRFSMLLFTAEFNRSVH